MREGKTAFITGITGQDGPYLARLLLQKGYTVHGLKPYCVHEDDHNLAKLLGTDYKKNPDLHLHYGDMTDGGNLLRLITQICPDEIYNLAAMSHVAVSYEMPEYTANANALGTLRLLEAIRTLGLKDKTRFYQASTSELFGNQPPPQSEITPLDPLSPYAAAKAYAYTMTKLYRESYGIYAINGILFNHESPLRGEDFVTRKIAKSVCNIEAGLQDVVTLGNLDAKRDWGHAEDYVRGMWLMLQQDTPQDFVLATGTSYSVRDCVTLAFRQIGVFLDWTGKDKEETGIDTRTGKTRVAIDPCLFRPLEVEFLCGDATKARQEMGWFPSTTLSQILREMIEHERAGLEDLKKDSSFSKSN